MSVLQGTVYAAELVAAPGTDLTGSDVACTVTAPDGTVSSPPVAVATNTATANIPAAVVGTYLIVWTVSGGLAGVQQDQFTVEAPTADLISLAEVKDELNLRADDTSKDAKLRRWMRAATGVVENVTGKILPETRTDLFPGGGFAIVLPERWISAVTAVAESYGSTSTVLTEVTFGQAPSGYAYTWDRTTNVLYRMSGSAAAAFARRVQVTYTAGLTTIPDDIQIAAAELVKHWYQKSLPFRSGTPFGSTTGDDAVMVGNYMVPNAVMELLEPYRRPPGIA